MNHKPLPHLQPIHIQKYAGQKLDGVPKENLREGKGVTHLGLTIITDNLSIFSSTSARASKERSILLRWDNALDIGGSAWYYRNHA